MDNEYAQPMRRVAAFLIDVLLVIAVLNVLFFRPNVFPGLIDIRVLGLVLVFVAYEALMVYFLGATVGKLLLSVQVVDAGSRGRPSIVQSFIRAWVKFFFGLRIINSALISLLALAFGIFNLYTLFTDEAFQAIHDRFARTVVVPGRRTSAQ